MLLLMEAKKSIFLFFLVLLSGMCLSASVSPMDYHNLNFDHITMDDGLPTGTVNDIFQDDQGFIWFATENGLCLYDAYNIITYRHIPYDTNSLTSNNLTCIEEDDEGNLWIGSKDGLNEIERRTGRITRYFSHEKRSLWSNIINDILKDSMGNIWVATSKGLNKLDKVSNQFERIELTSIPNAKNPPILTEIFEHKGYLWIGTWKGGLYSYNITDHGIQHYNIGNENSNTIQYISTDDKGNLILLNSTGKISIFSPFKESPILFTREYGEQIYSFLKDNNDYYWIGLETGVKIAERADFNTIHTYSPDPANNISVSGGIVNSIYQDHHGNVWLSSKGIGIDVHLIYQNDFRKYFNTYHNQKRKDFGSAIYADDDGTTWYGTFGDGLLKFNRGNELIKRYVHEEGRDNTLAGNSIWCITKDRNNNLWIGTNNGISVFSIKENRFIKTIRKLSVDTNTLIHNTIYDILVDDPRRAWIATQEGVNILDLKTGDISHLGMEKGLLHYKVRCIFKDTRENIWFGTYNGLSCLKTPAHDFINYQYSVDSLNTLSNNAINGIYEDENGYIWVGTEYGLNKINPKTHDITRFYEEDGLISNTIENISGDGAGNIWLAGSKGISIYHVASNNFVNYDRSDGLRINHAGMYSDGIHLYLAGESPGYYKFSPGELKTNEIHSRVHITKVKIDGKDFMDVINNYGELNGILKINYQATIEFEFSLLNYTAPEKSRYGYQLKGFDHGWQKTDPTIRYAKYSNLKPGEYTFSVKAWNNNNVRSHITSHFEFVVIRPWWLSVPAIIFYILTLILIFITWISFRRRRIALMKIIKEAKENVEKEKLRAKLQHESDEHKLRFFTNISHEFRTPLTIINGTLNHIHEALVSGKQEKGEKFLQLLQNNVEHLLGLINQLLDIRSLEANKAVIKVQKINLHDFIYNIVNNFKAYAKQQGITFVEDIDLLDKTGWLDPEKSEKILFNLLSNAVKYCNKMGKVSVEARVVFNKANDRNQIEMLYIKVTNDGKLIPKEELHYIFDRYYRLSDKNYHGISGTGIGLSLVKELAELHKGNIEAVSKPESGNSFVLEIPIGSTSYTDEEKERSPVQISSRKRFEMGELIPEDSAHFPEIMDHNMNDRDYQMLIVEDNDDLRYYLTTIFEESFKIIVAKNGVDGFEKALLTMPDIIVSDIMMPGMNGNDLCKKIKGDTSTSHIPVILLTAKVKNTDKIEGYQAGADGYVEKPFDEGVLIAQVFSLLETRSNLIKKFRSDFGSLKNNLEEIPLSSDDDFLKIVVNIIEKNISNPDLGADSFLKELSISRTSLYKKFNQVTGYPINTFIKIYRLKKAAHLLKARKNLSISEIAYELGFKHPSSFTRSFLEYYNQPPKTYRDHV